MDGHMGLANSKALSLAHVTEDFLDPEGGNMIRDGHGSRFLSGLVTDISLDATVALND